VDIITTLVCVYTVNFLGGNEKGVHFAVSSLKGSEPFGGCANRCIYAPELPTFFSGTDP